MGEIKSLHPYLPFKEESIDLLILDEASQVNLAEIFPVLFRAKSKKFQSIFLTNTN